MTFLRSAPAGVCALLAAGGLLRAHDEWNNLHLVNSSKSELVYPFDGRSPKVAAAILNHYPVPSVEVTAALSVNGRTQTGVKGFTGFPNGGGITAAPDDYMLVTAWTAGVYDGAAGAAPAVGETKVFNFVWNFALAPGVTEPPRLAPPGAPNPFDPSADPPGVVSAPVKFTNLGDNPVLTGPMGTAGTVRAAEAGAGAGAVVVEVATPQSNWFRVPTTPGAGAVAVTFSQALPERADWHVRLSGEGLATRVIALGSPFDPRVAIDVTLAPAPVPALDYKRVAAVALPTGSGRGAVAESEGTLVVFPGQDVWRAGANDAENRALRAPGRVAKYRFDGTKLWEHTPGWEVGGGDMSPDGKYVVYALNPTVLPFYTPTEHKVVLLDGATGAVLWTKATARADAVLGAKLESLEVALSPDAKWIAVGSVSSGQVTLLDRATGNLAWSVPTAAPSFGQVRRLRFSADSQSLYCGSGDSRLRKLRVSDGAVVWKTFVGSWPTVGGLDVSGDGEWLATGSASLDTAITRASDGRQLWLGESQAADAAFAPDGRHVVTAGGHVYRTVDGSLAGLAKAPGPWRFSADGKYLLRLGQRLALHDLGGKVLKDFGDTGLAPGGAETVAWAHATRDGRYVILAGKEGGTAPISAGLVIFERQGLSGAVAPVIAIQPLAQSVATGGGTTLAVGASGPGVLAYQWAKNGTALPGANAPALTLAAVGAADAGTYTCVVANGAGATVSAPAELKVVNAIATDPARLSNLAVRTEIGPSAPLIVGFVVGRASGPTNKPLLLRGMGPSLASLGFATALPDPRLVLFGESGALAANDNWAGDAVVAETAARVGAFAFASALSRDAALAALPSAGGYTMQVASSDGATGTAIAEIYDASTGFSAAEARLVNVSARGEVGGTNGPLIAGFVVAGPTAKTVLVRGIGPTLAGFGVRGALGDPQLTVFRGSALVATNDNWHDAPNAVSMPDAAARVGAFRLGTTALDAALLLTLPPGPYTAQVTGVGGGQGSALVEVYDVP